MSLQYPRSCAKVRTMSQWVTQTFLRGQLQELLDRTDDDNGVTVIMLPYAVSIRIARPDGLHDIVGPDGHVSERVPAPNDYKAAQWFPKSH